jgi:ABC-2 type transport system permease protein
MIGLFRSEWLKLRTTRTAFVLALALLAVTAISTVGILVVADDFDLSSADWQADLPAAASFSFVFALLFGILVMTGEFRHGTATPTFLVSPLRERVLIAKTAAAALGGFVLAFAATLLVYLITVPWLVVSGDEIHLFAGEALRVALGLLVAATIWGALGVGLGAVVRSQVGAMIGALVWLLIVEHLVASPLPGIAPYLPGAALTALFGDTDDLSSIAAVFVSLGYAAAFCIAGTLVTVHRDIT